MTEAIHLGLTPWDLKQEMDAEALCGQAELAESWGFDSFFLPESHLTLPFSLPDPLMLLSAVAARTRRIALGTTSYLLPMRHPLLAAEQVATLDQLCRGRLILGLGRGYNPDMLRAFGVKSADKRQLFSDALEQMLAAWRNEPVAGTENLRLRPLPVQKPHPVLWIAAFGPKAIAQVGKLGYPYLASPMEGLPDLEDNYRRFHAALDEAGHQRPEHTAVMRTVFISADSSQCRHVRETLGLAEDEPALIGDQKQVEREMTRLRERLEPTHIIAVQPRMGGLPLESREASLQMLRQLI